MACRERRSERGARGAETKRAHEQVVKRNIAHAGAGDKIHGALAVTHAAENRAQNVIGRDERNAEKADGQVCGGAADCFLRRRHDGSNGADKQQKKNSQRDRNAIKSSTVFPMSCAACFRFSAPTACAMLTVVPIASPTIITVSICMTCEPMETGGQCWRRLQTAR